MKRADIFTPNGRPSVTYVGEHLVEKCKRLTEYLEQGGAVVVVSGPSKSGKTVFIETVIGHDNLIHVSGANVTMSGDIWRRVFTHYGTPDDVRPDFLTLLVRELKGTGMVVFIDDFHYISKEIQAELATVIKEAVRDGLGFILASVPYHADDVVLANTDLRGRMLKIGRAHV